MKKILVIASLFLALGLTFSRHAGSPPISLVGSSSAAKAPNKGPYDLTALRIFNSTLMRVNDAYVDPTRVDPKTMLLAALDMVQKQVAEVLVEPKPAENRVVVRVDTAQHEFTINEVDSPWALSKKMREIFQFVSENLPPNTDHDTVRNIEYAATNGMLSTLDPHSILLDPTSYGEMKLQTRGSFGGLGIVIGVRNDSLTVIKPMRDTPAWNAGIRKGDRIARIGKESTVNMMLNDAVSRLRGDPGTKVELWIERAKDKAGDPKKLILTRDEIKVRTVTAGMIKNSNVGYVKLHTSFGGNSWNELKAALADLQKKGMKSLVFDLRSNPGGLLDQAVKVTDEFVDSGTIVTTVGFANKQREEKRAEPGNQPHIPMAVLVNHGSASASEIVAGALKNLDRAVVIGTRTFGKGSVQVLYDNDDGSALKLTIAQYLTPGDVSIQSVGITPDVELDKVAIDKDKGIWLFRDYKGISEADLDAHLTSKNTRPNDTKPLETLKYLAEEPAKKPVAKTVLLDNANKDDDADAADAEPDDDEFADDTDDGDEGKIKEDYEVQFGRDLLMQAKGYKRREVLASSKAFFDKKRAEEQTRIRESLAKLGIDWTPVENGQTVNLIAQVSSDRPKNLAEAGETIKLKMSITNKGPGTAGQVHANLKGDDFLFEGREFLFGRIKAGETKTFVVPVKVPKDVISRVDPLKIEVTEQNGNKAQVENGGTVQLALKGLDKPLFAYSYQIIDDAPGNGDGLIQKGESERLHVTVKNIGTGASQKTQAQLRSLSDEGVFMNKGRFDIDKLAPGESKSLDFTFDVKPEYAADNVKVEMSVYDRVLHEYVAEKLTFPIAPAEQVMAAQGAVVAKADNTPVYGAASKESPTLGTAKRDQRFKLLAAVGGFYGVEIEPGRRGFVSQAAFQKSDGGTVSPLVLAMQVSPPKLEIKNAPELVTSNRITLSGTARDESHLADVFIFVSNRTAKIDHRKVFYSSNRKGQNSREMGFAAPLPLWPGANVVTVVARQSTQVQSQQTMVIEYDVPQVATTAPAAKPASTAGF